MGEVKDVVAHDTLVAFRVPSTDPGEQNVVVWDAFSEVAMAPGPVEADPQTLARLALSFDRPGASYEWVESPETDTRVPSPARRRYFPQAKSAPTAPNTSPPSTQPSMCETCSHASVCVVRTAANAANIQLGVLTCSHHV